jgi:hypothetical protein
MAVGIWSNNVYFLDPPPAPTHVLAGLQDLTGVLMGVVPSPADTLELFHPTSPDWLVDVQWSTDRLAKLQLVRAELPELPLPYPNHPHAIYLSGDPRPSPRSYQYLVTSLYVVLQAFGGQVERLRLLPDWAGKKWAEMPPLGFWDAMKERLK